MVFGQEPIGEHSTFEHHSQHTGNHGLDATKVSSKSGARTMITTIVGGSKMLYRGMDLMRTLTLICNLIFLVLGLIVVGVTNPWKMQENSDYCCVRLVPLGILRTLWRPAAPSRTFVEWIHNPNNLKVVEPKPMLTTTSRLFFIFAVIPLINIGLVALEIYKNMRSSWSARLTIITVIISTAFLSPLVIFTMSCYWPDEVHSPWRSYCPYYWTIYGSLEMEGLNTNMINFTLTWLPPLMLLFYLSFLTLAWIAKRRQYTVEPEKPSVTGGTSDLQRQSGASSFGRDFYGAESMSSDFNTSFNDSQRFSLDTLPTDSSSAAASRPPSYRERARISEMTVRIYPT